MNLTITNNSQLLNSIMQSRLNELGVYKSVIKDLNIDEYKLKMEALKKADTLINGGGLNYFRGSEISRAPIRVIGEGALNYNKFDFSVAYSKLNYTGGDYPDITAKNSLNNAGVSKYLNTPLGEMEVFVDVNGDNDKYGVGKLDFVGLLINMDNNRDGFLDSNDYAFDKLKLRGFDSNGDEVILKFSDVYNSLDLSRFVKTTKDIDNNRTISGTALFRAEESYKKLDSENLKKIFETFSDKDGWIKTKDLPLDINFAYKKESLGGGSRLQAFTLGLKNLEGSYVDEIKNRFNEMYKSYHSNTSFGNQYAIRAEFQAITGLSFSERKFNEFHTGLNDPKNAEQYANFIKDIDQIEAMRLNEYGSVTLKFNSGRTLNIAELYISDGEFNVTEKGERASVASELNEIEEAGREEIDFNSYGVQTNSGILSLSQLGIDFIQKISFENGRSGFVLTDFNGVESFVDNLYRIRSVENAVRFSEVAEKDKLCPRFDTMA
ncbi:MAG: hypothetical protein SOW25_01340 [Helicobacter sp.]|nr:hypothetical protein [Helicobacter sp.]